MYLLLHGGRRKKSEELMGQNGCAPPQTTVWSLLTSQKTCDMGPGSSPWPWQRWPSGRCGVGVKDSESALKVLSQMLPAQAGATRKHRCQEDEKDRGRQKGCLFPFNTEAAILVTYATDTTAAIFPRMQKNSELYGKYMSISNNWKNKPFKNSLLPCRYYK